MHHHHKAEFVIVESRHHDRAINWKKCTKENSMGKEARRKNQESRKSQTTVEACKHTDAQEGTCQEPPTQKAPEDFCEIDYSPSQNCSGKLLFRHMGRLVDQIKTRVNFFMKSSNFSAAGSFSGRRRPCESNRFGRSMVESDSEP